MGSKKDRLKAAAEKQLKKATDESAGMRRLVEDIESDRSPAEANPASGARDGASSGRSAGNTGGTAEPSPTRKMVPEQEGDRKSGTGIENPDAHGPRRESQTSERIRMARTRDSVYNVSSDIRLEDYTESESGGGGRIGRIVAAVFLVLLLGWGVSKAWGWIFAPGYQLAIAGQEITDENMKTYLKGDTISASPGRPMVHIRFQWDEGELKTDLLRIRADQEQSGAFSEIATLSRKVPVTVNYVYFANILEPGKYRVQVTNKEGKVLRERTIRVQ